MAKAKQKYYVWSDLTAEREEKLNWATGNGGYAIDLFDRDEYDIVSPDEEDELESIMHGELDGKNDGSASHGHSVSEHIPVDDEATVENF